MVTEAPGMTAPAESVTTPRTVPRSVPWPKAWVVDSKTVRHKETANGKKTMHNLDSP